MITFKKSLIVTVGTLLWLVVLLIPVFENPLVAIIIISILLGMNIVFTIEQFLDGEK